ncbi:hypothetical protein [Photobacterium sp. R1]
MTQAITAQQQKESFSAEQQAEFLQFADALEALCDQLNINWGNSDHAFLKRCQISLTFSYDEEHLADTLIRQVRQTLLDGGPDFFSARDFNGDSELMAPDHNRFPVRAYKSYIISHNYWCLEFYFTNERGVPFLSEDWEG